MQKLTETQLHDTPGEETVVLTRSFGNEKYASHSDGLSQCRILTPSHRIRVSFSTADLSDAEPDPDAYQEDSALYDEEVGGASQAQSGGAQSKGTVNQGRTQGGNIAVAPEDKVSPADREAAAEDKDAGGAAADEDLAPEPDTSYPVRLHVSVEKKGVEGALYIESIVRDGTNYIENVYHFPRAELADPKTAERDWERRGLYTGPPFGNLDEELQVLLERYLEERGINTALALWVPDYIDFKEQREYMSWLSGTFSYSFCPPTAGLVGADQLCRCKILRRCVA